MGRYRLDRQWRMPGLDREGNVLLRRVVSVPRVSSWADSSLWERSSLCEHAHQRCECLEHNGPFGKVNVNVQGWI